MPEPICVVANYWSHFEEIRSISVFPLACSTFGCLSGFHFNWSTVNMNTPLLGIIVIVGGSFLSVCPSFTVRVPTKLI